MDDAGRVLPIPFGYPHSICSVRDLEVIVPENGQEIARPRLGVSVIIPTLNEVGNVRELYRRLDEVLKGVDWEVIFVDDDSPDGTADAVREIAVEDRRVRCIQRIGRRGLSSACIEGAMASSGTHIAVMDADLQHDERALPRMLDVFRCEGNEIDIVIASRYVAGGSSDWSGLRSAMSRWATGMSRLVIRVPVTDPMSGFFVVRRESFMWCCRRLSLLGFKLLLDLLASSPQPLRFREVPYRFRERATGDSKFDANAVGAFVLLLAEKTLGRYVPIRFLSFVAVGSLGIGVHFGTLATLLKLAGMRFEWAQACATVAAMSFNFFVNNQLTYRDRRLHGWQAIRGLLSFYAACGLGAVANVGISGVLFRNQFQWWLAAIAGILISAVWNYAATANFVWNRR